MRKCRLHSSSTCRCVCDPVSTGRSGAVEADRRSSNKQTAAADWSEIEADEGKLSNQIKRRRLRCGTWIQRFSSSDSKVEELEKGQREFAATITYYLDLSWLCNLESRLHFWINRTWRPESSMMMILGSADHFQREWTLVDKLVKSELPANFPEFSRICHIRGKSKCNRETDG